MATVRELFQHANVIRSGAVRWGTPVPEGRPGVYVISTSEDPDRRPGPTACPLNIAALEELVRARSELTVDGDRAEAVHLAARLRAMWPAGESVVYIGKAGTDTGHRVKQFYDTRIGARAPHAGGWPVKMLETGLLSIHYGVTSRPDDAEEAMVALFAEAVPFDVRRSLVDPSAPLPFANLEYPAGRRKAHRIGGAKEPRRKPSQLASLTATPSPGPSAADEPTGFVASFGRRVPQKEFGTCPECFTLFTAAGTCGCLA